MPSPGTIVRVYTYKVGPLLVSLVSVRVVLRKCSEGGYCNLVWRKVPGATWPSPNLSIKIGYRSCSRQSAVVGLFFVLVSVMMVPFSIRALVHAIVVDIDALVLCFQYSRVERFSKRRSTENITELLQVKK